MVIGWENVCWCQLTVPGRVLEARAALPQVRFTLDIKQAMRAGGDPVRKLDKSKQYLEKTDYVSIIVPNFQHRYI